MRDCYTRIKTALPIVPLAGEPLANSGLWRIMESVQLPVDDPLGASNWAVRSPLWDEVTSLVGATPSADSQSDRPPRRRRSR